MAELLVAALFGMIVMATLYGFFQEQLFNLLSQETKTATLEDARGALDMMVRELRNAGSWGTGTQPTGCSRIVQATEFTIQVQMDTRGASAGSAPDGDCGDSNENVTFTYSSPSGNIIRNVTTSPLVSNVIIPSGSRFLTYYPSGTDPAPYCYSTGNPAGCSGDLAANLANIKRVKIAFAVQVQNPNPYSRSANPNISSTLSSSVEFRN